VSKIATGQFQINPAGNTYINLVHGQGVMTDPATGQPIAVGAQIRVGQPVIQVGNIAPQGGASNGCHLHFEVDIGYTYLGSGGTGYDVDPTPYILNNGCRALIAVQGFADNQLYVCQAGQGGFTPLGGYITGAPAAAFANGRPMYVAVAGSGPNRGYLYVRTDSLDWQPLVASNCSDNPGIAVNGSTLYVACRGTTDSKLYVGSTNVPPSGLPSLPGLNPAGGLISSQGPAVAMINGSPNYYVVGSSNPDGNLYFTTGNGQWYQRTGWSCTGHVGVASRGSKVILVCHGLGNDYVWYATSGDGGASWIPVSQITVLGTVLDGVGAAMALSGDAVVVVENRADNSVDQASIPWASSATTAPNIPSTIFAGPAAAQS
jgi:hypothetical protein